MKSTRQHFAVFIFTGHTADGFTVPSFDNYDLLFLNNDHLSIQQREVLLTVFCHFLLLAFISFGCQIYLSNLLFS